MGRWTAPEILNEEGTHSKEADIFSFAMVMVEARSEWVICIKPWLTTVSHLRSYLLAQFHSVVAYLQRPCWR